MALLLRKVSGRRAIKGVGRVWMLKALNHMGYGAVRQRVGIEDTQDTRPTLAAWLKSVVRPEGTIFLISAGNHWQVISGRRFVCGRTKEIVSLRDPRVRRRSRVKDAWRIVHISDEGQALANHLPDSIENRQGVEKII